jgi:hypothetical protein
MDGLDTVAGVSCDVREMGDEDQKTGLYTLESKCTVVRW